MSQQELLVKVTQVLNELGIDYMITGSMASNMQGEPRLTHDIDIVTITIPEKAIPELMKFFLHRNIIWMNLAFEMPISTGVCSIYWM